jgi:hypothetical protein
VVWDPQGPNVVDLADGPSGDGTRKAQSKPAKPRGRTRGNRAGKRAGKRAGNGAATGAQKKSLGDTDDSTEAGDERDDDGGEAEAVPDEDTRRGGELAKLINGIIDESIAAPLAAAGFRRAGRTWRHHLDDGAIQVVNVQWSPRDRVEGWFTLNAGVYFPALARLIAEFPVTDSPKEYDCHVRKRPLPLGISGWTVRVPGGAEPDSDMKGLFGGLFSWLDRRADRKAAEQQARAPRELREALDQHAFPWLERVSTLRGARDELTRRGPAFWGAHVSLLLGEREEAARILERELAKAIPEYAETIRKWGRQHGLLA